MTDNERPVTRAEMEELKRLLWALHQAHPSSVLIVDNDPPKGTFVAKGALTDVAEAMTYCFCLDAVAAIWDRCQRWYSQLRPKKPHAD